MKGRPVSEAMLQAVEAYRSTNKPVLEICREFGVSSGALCAAAKRVGANRVNYPTRQVPGQWKGITGENHPCWKGGVGINPQGYPTRYAPEHPYQRGQCAQIPEHILIIETALGRRLEDGEVIHHRDGDRTNNERSNLQVMARGAHSSLHRLREQERG